VGETFNRFAILGCELYKNVVGCRAPPGPAAGVKGKKGLGIGMGRKGRARKDVREVVGRYGKEKGGVEMGRKEWEEEGRVREREGAEGEIGYGKGQRGLDLDIYRGASEFLVTPLSKTLVSVSVAIRPPEVVETVGGILSGHPPRGRGGAIST